MPSLWSVLPSSSSSSSSSPSPSNSKSKSTQKIKKGSKSFGWSFQTSPKRRLTRQHKLRYVTDDEVGLRRPQSMPVSPVSTSRSSCHWSRSAVPQPLPLPEVNSHLPKKFSTSLPNSAITRSNSSFGQPRAESVNLAPRTSPGTATTQSNISLQSINVKGKRPEFRVKIPTRSAPSSHFSSPTRSPQRFSTGDLFRSSDRPRNKVPNSDSSSQHPSQNLLNQNNHTQLSHHKSLPDYYGPCHESNNISLHPLPLPPGVLRPSQSSIVHHPVDRSETSIVKGQWKKGKLIGRGTYGSVYVATNRETGALCAMKEVDLVPDDPKSAECIKQLEQEIKVLQQIRHPNIVQYYGCETIGESFCIYLEYVHPGSIDKYVKEHSGVMSESIVRNFTRHILSGLACIHSMKTIHRDIKGANLLVNSSGIVKLADFGLAKHLTGQATNLSLKGSPHWMAPEVLQAVMRNDANPDLACAVDVWSVGCTVIEMLTGKPPWSEFNAVQAMFNVLKKTPAIPETLSSEGKDFLQQCLQREPTARPSVVKLLDHPFLQSIQDQNVAVCR